MVDISRLTSPLTDIPYAFGKKLVHWLIQKVYAPTEISPKE